MKKASIKAAAKKPIIEPGEIIIRISYKNGVIDLETINSNSNLELIGILEATKDEIVRLGKRK